jgi:hypothetical protein
VYYCNTFYKNKTNKNSKIRYRERISEIKLKNTAPNSNFTKQYKNNFNNILNLETHLKKNILYQYILDNNK